MILIDTNILVYSCMKTLDQHEKAKIFIDTCLNGESPAGIPWHSILGFLRTITNPRIFSPPVPPAEAWKIAEYWLNCPPVWIPAPTENHLKILSRLFAETSPQGNLVPDAHLAALAIEHGLILCSTDSDFSRFKDLKWKNPLFENFL